MVNGIEHPNRAPTTFVELSKTHCPHIEAAHCPDETRPFRLAISERFYSIAVFNSSNITICL